MSTVNSGNAGEFLVDLQEQEAFLVLHNVFTQNLDLTLKNEAEAQSITAKIIHFADRKVFLETDYPNEKLAGFKGLTSIKFFIGTEVYFIKTPIQIIDNVACFEQAAKIVQLRRRKEPRYNIPDSWSQTAAVWSIELKIKNSARVVDISQLGIRFEVPMVSLKINQGDTIRIQYQIFKRGEVVCDAIVRFIMTKSNGTAILGLEFTGLQKNHTLRIRSIIEDLANYYETKSLL